MKQNSKILVAMSGGVDSSVAAALLVAKGYDVTGAFMVNYEESPNDQYKCWTSDYQDALRVAAKLGIPLLRLDFKKEYERDVLNYMYAEYRAGRTPNPDVLCNKFVKFGAWLDKAKEMGFDYLATGHYARLGREILNPKSEILNKSKIQMSNIKLLRAKDENKDQTYFLHQLNQEQLRYTMFPIGEYTKTKVRQLAKKFDLPTAEKEESMGICFVGERPMKEFLMKKIKPEQGKIVLSDGTIAGEHEGVAFYTIGQRVALEIRNPKSQIPNKFKYQNSKPVFVLKKDLEKNEIVAGYEDDPLLYKKEIIVSDVHWIRQMPKFPLKCKVRLRHRQALQRCVIKTFPPKADQPLAEKHKNIKTSERENATMLQISFDKPQRAITPGQFAVFYKNNQCLGGGVIEN